MSETSIVKATAIDFSGNWNPIHSQNQRIALSERRVRVHLLADSSESESLQWIQELTTERRNFTTASVLCGRKALRSFLIIRLLSSRQNLFWLCCFTSFRITSRSLCPGFLDASSPPSFIFEHFHDILTSGFSFASHFLDFMLKWCHYSCLNLLVWDATQWCFSPKLKINRGHGRIVRYSCMAPFFV